MKRGADAWLTFHGDAASMGIDDIFHNLRAEPCSADLAAGGAVGEEAFEDFGGHSFAGINDRQQDALSLRVWAATHRDRSARRNFRNRVIDEIIHRIEQPALIGMNDREGLKPLHAQCHLAFIGPDAERVLAAPSRRLPDLIDPALEHRLAVVPEHDNRVLRVIVNTQSNPVRVVTLYFDRTMRGKL